jgi:hypothetical protein
MATLLAVLGLFVGKRSMTGAGGLLLQLAKKANATKIEHYVLLQAW